MSSDGWYTDKLKVDNRPKPRAPEFYRALAERDLELIEAQREEINRLKQRNNQLEQRRYLKTTANAIPAV